MEKFVSIVVIVYLKKKLNKKLKYLSLSSIWVLLLELKLGIGDGNIFLFRNVS